MTTASKDLTKEAPRSPRERIGDYHYDWPLDNILFSFKGVTGDDFKKQIESGATDEDMAKWLDQNGTFKTPEEVKQWSDGIEAYSMANDENPEKREFFVEECKKLGL